MRGWARRNRYMIAVAVLGAVAALSLLVALVALQYARQFYIERSQLKLAPAYDAAFADENARLPPPIGVRVVMFGDSRIARWDPKPRLNGFEFAWRGISGETTAQMIYRYEADTRGAGASIVVIQAGINDLVAGNAAGEAAAAVDSAYRNIQTMVEKSTSGGIDVILMTVVRPARPPLVRRVVWSDSIYGDVRELNLKLHTLAGPRVRILDADKILSGDSRTLPKRYARDTLHFLPAAYVVLNQKLTEALQARPHAVQ